MKINNLNKLINDEPLFKKVLLAYWYSIPSDSDRIPDKIDNVRDNDNFFGVDLFKKSVHYGYAAITKKEIENYIIKLQSLKWHEDDIIERIDREKD